ncbi:hypothetical protein [Agromyces arachidis]|uniref:hypothetical protein n=1 Tax=Agromyces arachidis TaxID=766966 RepID=UPI004055BA91
MTDDDATRPVPHEPATERLDTADAGSEPENATAARRMRWMWVAIAALAVAVVVLLLFLLLRPGATPIAAPTASPTPSASPSATPTATASPEPTTTSTPVQPTSEPTTEPVSGPVFTSFSAEPATADCSGGATSVPLVFSWSSEGATEAWIGVGTTDAQAAPYESVPTSASNYSNLAYQCSEESQVYTVTLSGPSGVTHNSVTIVRG